MKTLLSVDFDFFFPVYPYDEKRWQMYDWGHDESWSHTLLDVIWIARGAAFLRHDKQLPCSQGIEGFWDRFKFNPNTKLYLADSHKEAIAEEVIDSVTSVWNFDMHHDSCYGNLKRVYHDMVADCGSWMAVYNLVGADTHVRYPEWAEFQVEQENPECPVLTRKVYDPNEELPTYDRIFLCRSSHWVPPWLDEEFLKLVDTCPVNDKMYLTTLRKREFDIEQVKLIARAEEEFLNSYKETESDGTS